ncbi:65-kDa microtubule-associated protein 8 [Linum perenne]
MRLRKEDRLSQFRAVQGQIQRISAEIAGQSVYDVDSITNVTVNENDLSMKKLEEYQSELQRLHKEKVLKQKFISTWFLTDKLFHVAKSLTNLWNLIDMPYEDRRRFFHVTNLLRTPLQSDPGSLALNVIEEDENRYSVSRGAHRNLRRAERARILVSKIPDLVPLLAMVEEYSIMRLEKEEEKKRRQKVMNMKKKLPVQVTEPAEAPFSSRPGTSSNRRPSNRRLSSTSINAATQARKMQMSTRFHDETASVVSTFSGPVSP